MLDINPFAKMFSHSVVCLFIVLMVSFTVFDVVLLIFAFVALAKGKLSKKILLRVMSKILLSMFISRNFMISGLTLKSSIFMSMRALNKMSLNSNVPIPSGGWVIHQISVDSGTAATSNDSKYLRPCWPTQCIYQA